MGVYMNLDRIMDEIEDESSHSEVDLLVPCVCHDCRKEVYFDLVKELKLRKKSNDSLIAEYLEKNKKEHYHNGWYSATAVRKLMNMARAEVYKRYSWNSVEEW